jgi:hypothetical protein
MRRGSLLVVKPEGNWSLESNLDSWGLGKPYIDLNFNQGKRAYLKELPIYTVNLVFEESRIGMAYDERMLTMIHSKYFVANALGRWG